MASGASPSGYVRSMTGGDLTQAFAERLVNSVLYGVSRDTGKTR